MLAANNDTGINYILKYWVWCTEVGQTGTYAEHFWQLYITLF